MRHVYYPAVTFATALFLQPHFVGTELLRLHASRRQCLLQIDHANSRDLVARNWVEDILLAGRNFSQPRKRTEGWENQEAIALPEAWHSLRLIFEANSRVNMTAQPEFAYR